MIYSSFCSFFFPILLPISLLLLASFSLALALIRFACIRRRRRRVHCRFVVLYGVSWAPDHLLHLLSPFFTSSSIKSDYVSQVNYMVWASERIRFLFCSVHCGFGEIFDVCLLRAMHCLLFSIVLAVCLLVYILSLIRWTHRTKNHFGNVASFPNQNPIKYAIKLANVISYSIDVLWCSALSLH